MKTMLAAVGVAIGLVIRYPLGAGKFEDILEPASSASACRSTPPFGQDADRNPWASTSRAR